jgi:hypothetical protein
VQFQAALRPGTALSPVLGVVGIKEDDADALPSPLGVVGVQKVDADDIQFSLR